MKNLQRSIRFRLTLYYSLIVGGTLLGFAVASYFYTEQNLLSSLDRSLYQEVVTIKNFIEPQAKKVRLKKPRPRQKPQSIIDKKSAAETVRDWVGAPQSLTCASACICISGYGLVTEPSTCSTKEVFQFCNSIWLELACLYREWLSIGVVSACVAI